MSRSLSILIVSYNTRDMTLACLASVFVQAREVEPRVIVVDNASEDGSADAIAERFPQVELIRLDRNIGFAAANNLAARRAKGEWLLLLNPDTVVLDGAIDRIVRFTAVRPGHGIYGGRTVFADGSLNPTSCWGRMTLWSAFCRASGLSSVFRNSRVFDPESLGCWRRDTVREVDIVTGCFLLIQRELWERLGGFDEAFFMYGEEADLNLRAKKLGARSIICPEATIIHYGGASEPVRTDKVVRLFDCKARLMRKHWSAPAAALGVKCLGAWALHRGALLWLGWALTRSKRMKEGADSWLGVWRARDRWLACSAGSSPAEAAP